MKISIITICYNNENDIEPTLISVVNQTYSNIEYIVVDGNSTDGTLSIIEKYKEKIDVFLSEPDEGMYDAINKGIKRATGEVIGLIHAGDRLYENSTISKIAKHFDEFPEIDGMYGNSKIVTPEGKLRMINIGGEFSNAKIKDGWMPSHQSIYLKKNVFEWYGYYRNDLGGSGDYELFIRVFYCQHLKINFLNEFILYFTLGGRSTKSILIKLKSQKIHIKCWRLNGLKPPVFLPLRKIINGMKKRVYGLLQE